MGAELLTIRAGGGTFAAFESISIEAAIDEAVRSFDMSVAGELGAASPSLAMLPGTAVDILSNGDLMLRGFVDRYRPSSDGHGGSEVKISGRAKGQDFVDCAAVHDTGRFEKQTLLQIAQKLDVFGVGIIADVDLDPIDDYQITPGEKAFEAIEKEGRKLGVTFTGEPDGRIRITKAGKTRHAGGLIEGVNFLSMSSDLDWSKRHSKIIVRGQSQDGDGEKALAVEATATDAAIKRNRPLILIEDSDIDQAAAQKRADTRRDREAGASLKANGATQGFRDDAGVLWKPGNLVWAQSPFLNVTQVMLIKSVKFSQGRGGSTSELTLIDPRAFGGKSGKGGDAGDEWSIDDDD